MITHKPLAFAIGAAESRSFGVFSREARRHGLDVLPTKVDIVALALQK